jgi:uncharacterized RDD family membrane protein YckC
MELVPGESLAERLARGPVPPDEAIELVRQAALGLREAHRQGFTHRDVKPSNLMVDHEGRVKVVDFGLVKGGGETAAPGQVDQTGVVGTPLYMAPEQAAGAPIDARADIYALGATLHHLVSGRPPFESDSVDALATLHRSGPRPRLEASGRRGRALSAVDATIARMMAKRPQDRFGSYDELLGELDRISPRRTRPAGLWVRTFAMGIDLILMTMLIIPLELIAMQFDRAIDDNLAFVLGGVLAALSMSRWGVTPGRALLDIEVVTVEGLRRPPLRVALLRYAVEVGPLAVAVLIAMVGELIDMRFVDDAVVGILSVGGILWGIGGLIWASLRTPDKRAPWDRVAGTMVRYRAGNPA